MSYSSTQQERQPEAQTLPPGLFEAAATVRNIDPHNLVAPLREVQRIIAKASVGEEAAKEIQVAIRLQDQWEAWLVERELLRNETQRGRECLEQIRRELGGLRQQLEEWPVHERICGHNPLPDYLRSIYSKELIESFLPAWLERREQQLAALTRKMEVCAQENGLEHLL